MPDIRHCAIDWLHRGYFPIPIPYREKGPKIEDWQHLHATDSTVPNYFNGQGYPQNIGVLLGPNGNCDIDLDSPEAVAAFPLFAPDTGLIFGRRSKPRSHWFYRIDPPRPSVKYLDPVHGTMLLEFRCLKTDGSVGLQTMVPDSVHPSGEPVEFALHGEPGNVDASELGRAVRWTAAVALLKRHWPAEGGGRHAAFLALSGALVHARWGLNEATQLVCGLYQLLWPGSADLSRAAREVETTFRGFDDGKQVTGLPALAKLVAPAAPKVVQEVANWLGLGLQRPQAQKQEPSKQSGNFVMTPVFDISPEPVEWLWNSKIPRGKLTLLAGDPGLGKSLLTSYMAAVISRGGKWPLEDSRSPCGDVILLSAEDDAGDTIRPRLEAMEADLARIHVLQGVISGVTGQGRQSVRMFDLQQDIDRLSNKLAEMPQVGLIVIDPISAYLGKNIDSHKNAEVRAVLSPLIAAIAERHVALIGISHLSKAPNASALMRIIGSLAFAATARAVHLVVADAQNKARRLFLPLKNNLSPDSAGLAFHIEGHSIPSPRGPIGTARILWETEPVTITAEEAILARAPSQNSILSQATEWLVSILGQQPLPANQILADAARMGITEITLRRAVKNLRIQKRKERFSGRWMWSLSEHYGDHEEDNNQGDHHPPI